MELAPFQRDETPTNALKCHWKEKIEERKSLESRERERDHALNAYQVIIREKEKQ